LRFDMLALLAAGMLAAAGTPGDLHMYVCRF